MPYAKLGVFRKHTSSNGKLRVLRKPTNSERKTMSYQKTYEFHMKNYEFSENPQVPTKKIRVLIKPTEFHMKNYEFSETYGIVRIRSPMYLAVSSQKTYKFHRKNYEFPATSKYEEVCEYRQEQQLSTIGNNSYTFYTTRLREKLLLSACLCSNRFRNHISHDGWKPWLSEMPAFHWAMAFEWLRTWTLQCIRRLRHSGVGPLGCQRLNGSRSCITHKLPKLRSSYNYLFWAWMTSTLWFRRVHGSSLGGPP